MVLNNYQCLYSKVLGSRDARETKSISHSRKVWWGESLVNLATCQRFTKLKPSKLVVIIITLWLNPFICQTFPHQTLKKSKFAKVSRRQTFPLYGTVNGRLLINVLDVFMLLTGKMCKILRLQQIVLLIQLLLIA